MRFETKDGKADYGLLKRMTTTHRCAECHAPLVLIWDGKANDYSLECGAHLGHQGYERIKSLTQEWDEGVAIPQTIADKLEKKYGRKSMTQQMEEKGLIIRPVMAPVSIEDLAIRAKDLDKFFRDLMQEGTDYGIIPGTPRPSLWKPGAELLRLWAGLAPSFTNDDSRSDRKSGFIHWLCSCQLLNRSGEVVGELSGSCNSHEAKYRWRWVWPRELPQGIDKGTLVSKVVDKQGSVKYRLENDNPADLDNTILKMAQKRAFVGGILMVTGASRIFTQTIEEDDEGQGGNGESVSQSSAVVPGAPPEGTGAGGHTEMPPGQLPLSGKAHDWQWFCSEVLKIKGMTVMKAMAILEIEKADQWKQSWDEALTKVKAKA